MTRLRLRFKKVGPVRYASHLDTVRIFHRCFAASGLPVCYSEGFHPHPRLSFGPPLKTGWEGLDEYMDLWLEKPVPGLEEVCNRALPEGMRIMEDAEISERAPKLATDITAAGYLVEVAVGADAERILQRARSWCSGLMAGEGGVSAGRKRALSEEAKRLSPCGTGSQTGAGVAFSPSLMELDVCAREGVVIIEYLSTMKEGKSFSPVTLVAELLGDQGIIESPIKVVRKVLFIERKGVFLSPIEGVEK